MAGGVIKSIFDAKKDLYEAYPFYPNIPTFDLHRKHCFYGKIDKESDIVFWDTNFRTQISSPAGVSAFVMDIVADAFFSLRVNYRKVATNISRDSVYYDSMKVFKSSFGYSLDVAYTNYMQVIYKNFIDSYLSINRRFEKVKNYRDFVKEFIKYSLKTIKNYPITTSGFISSIHCTPYVSGMVIEVSPREHGIENNKNIIQYLQDPYYEFWIKEVQKFGFMVDKNAPWRLVFNVASGFRRLQEDPDNPRGAQLFMSRYGLSYEDIFDFRFIKAYLYDMLLLKNIFETMYAQFYRQFSTYEEQKLTIDNSGRCNGISLSHQRKDRELPTEFTGILDEDDEYWIKVLMKLRFAETEFPHTPGEFTYHADLATRKYRLFGEENGLRYINDLTKGFFVTKFNIKGAYWHGVRQSEYEERLRSAEEQVIDSSRVQYDLVGTKNNVR